MRLALLLVLAVLSARLAGPAHAGEGEAPTLPGGFVRSAEGCRVWVPLATASVQTQDPVVVTWHGECPEGLAEGQGAADFPISTGNMSFRATFRAGTPNGIAQLLENGRLPFEGAFGPEGAEGNGTVHLETGATVSGEYHQGRLATLTAMTLPSGLSLTGRFDPMGRTGHGIARYPNGNRFEGTFLDSKYAGPGVLFYANGSRWEGNWRENKREGHGRYTAARGGYVDGEWRDDKLSGRAIGYSPDGAVLSDLHWRDGRREGQGFLTLRDKRRYDGAWANDLPEGRGRLIQPDGTVIEGEWHRGCLLGSAPVAVLVEASACR